MRIFEGDPKNQCFNNPSYLFLSIVIVFVKKLIEISIKIELGDKLWENSNPRMIAELNGKKKGLLFLPARAQPVRDCHSLANEKPLYFKLSILPVDSLNTIGLPGLSPHYLVT